MKILIISNENIEEVKEDYIIAKSFEDDGNLVKIVNANYSESLDDEYDVFIKRNAYYENETLDLCADKLGIRLSKKNKIMINFNGKFDTDDKNYLVDLYYKGYKVIPTINDINELNILPNTNKYVLKPINSYDGIGQKIINQNEINEINDGYVLQPKLEFKKEVQFYFVNRKFCYVLEFTPSKVPVYPDAKYYEYTDKELLLAQSFADLNSNFVGIQRIDFLKAMNDEIFLLEIEDASPYLDLDCLSESDLNSFLSEYKSMVYDFVNSKLEKSF